MDRNVILSLFLILIFSSCSRKSDTKALSLEEVDLIESDICINKDSLGQIEGLQCNDSLLIVWDFHLGKSFTLFNTNVGECYGRFGTIGQGPTEIPIGCGGYISDGKYKIFNCSVGFIAQYDIASLCVNLEKEPDVLSRRVFTDDMFFSAVIPVNDSLYFGAGVYKSKNQYVLFNNKEVVDANVLIYNAYNDLFSKSHKILSNQGRLTKSPKANKFAFFLNYSSNIDFVEVVDNKVNILKLLRERDPVYSPIQEGTMNIVYPDRNNSIGYIDISSDEKFVYALYTDKKMEQTFSSDIICVFDWNGNLVKKYKLSQDAYFITVNESNNKLYAAIKDSDGGWDIISYNI